MLNRDFTNSTLNIIRSTMPKIEAPIQPDWAGIIRQAGKDYNEGALTRKMIDEHPEDEALIRQKGGSVYADMLKADAQRAEDRQWKLDDIASQRDFQRELLDAQTQRAFALENLRNQNARSLAEFKAGLGDLEKAKENAEKVEDEQKSLDLAQNGINQLYDVGKANNLGVFTDWRRKHGLTGWFDNDVETDMGKISSAVAAVAPRAIAQLKKAGVSGINTKGEFMQYIGLPENPTSQQILGALPRMAEIAGVEMPTETPSLKNFNSGVNAPLLDVGGTQNFNNGFSITRVK